MEIHGSCQQMAWVFLVMAMASVAAAAVADVTSGGSNGVEDAWGDGTVEGGGGSDVGSSERQAKVGNLGALGRSVLVELARQLVTNPATNSQVLSLNLTNLLILLVLKALLFGAGLFSFGALNHKGAHAASRSSEGSSSSYWPLMSEAELLLALSFLAGDTANSVAGIEGGPRGRSAAGASNPYACLQRVACEQPDTASGYVNAGRLVLKAAQVIDETVLPINSPKYEKIVEDLQVAVDYGRHGGACKEKFQCSN